MFIEALADAEPLTRRKLLVFYDADTPFLEG